MSAPTRRPRRLRGSYLLRETTAETTVSSNHLMWPLFVADGPERSDIRGMPGIERYNIEGLLRRVERALELGLRRFILFGVPEEKSPQARGAVRSDGIVPRAVRALKERFADAALIATDVCLCSYTDTGHCGLVDASGDVLNDASVEILAASARVHAEAGADMVAPSDMMDGRVAQIRSVLDEHGYVHVPILSYAVKYASKLYGPFRHAADSAPQFGDRRGYQMDVRNRREALQEALLDVEEGADMLMVKPGLAYLDILRDLHDATRVPLAAYQVSGEYSMLRYAAAAGAIDEAGATLETWIAMRRAGAQLILTYHAAQALEEGWLDN